jgi:tetratricopeptide (TPR) repeat protein
MSKKTNVDSRIKSLNETASSFYKSGKWEKAIEAYKELIDLIPSSELVEPSARAAICYRNLGKYSEGRRVIADAQVCFANNRWLQIEAALFDMHERDWQSAKKQWQRVLELSGKPLSALDSIGLAKTYEMTGSWQDHHLLINSAIKKYPEEGDLKARFMLSKALFLIEQENYLEALECLNFLEISFKSKWWNIDPNTLADFRDKCAKNIPLLPPDSISGNGLVLAMRQDGMGERLNAMLTGILLAKKLGYRYAFRWDDDLLNRIRKFGKDSESIKNIVGHAIAPAQSMFSNSYISKYHLTVNELPSHIKELSGKQLDLKSLLNREVRESLGAWASPRNDVRQFLAGSLSGVKEFSYQDAFTEIDFSEEIKLSINEAKKVELTGKLASIHLRTGDVFFSEYRKFVHYSYKGITLPIIKAIIQKLKDQGYAIIVFGQDIESLEYLKCSYDITLAYELIPKSCITAEQKAMFEIILMSRAQCIVAGTSGFARLSSWLGGLKVSRPSDFFDAQRQMEISLEDLEENSAEYHPLQAAFGYWYAYYSGRKKKDYDISVKILKQAYTLDPDNQLYPIVQAALHFKNENYALGEEALYLLVDKEYELHRKGELPFIKILLGKTVGEYNLSEYFEDLIVPLSQKKPYSLLIGALILNGRGDQEKSKEYCITLLSSTDNEQERNKLEKIVEANLFLPSEMAN